MPFVMEVGLVAGHIVLDDDPDPPRKAAQQPPSPIFGPCLLWKNDGPSQLLLCTYIYICCFITSFE